MASERYTQVLSMNEYQADAAATMIYKWKIIYPALGLASEAGEVADKIKKLIRDENIKFDGNEELHDRQRAEILYELGDVLWYVAALSRDLGVSLNELAHMNLEKLRLRQMTNKLNGSGDNR
jgi:NTP pyrophosphatase (non-canonical NTP hydrolase)